MLDIRRLYHQAVTADRIGTTLQPEQTYHRFADYRAYAMLDACVSHENVNDYLHPCISRLRHHDKEGGSSLLPTLICYLDNDRNQVATANRLFIQRNTLLYRLRKIETLCGVDLRNTATIMDIMFSLRLLDYLDLSEI